MERNSIVVVIGAPKGGCFDQGVVFQYLISWFSWFLKTLEFSVFKRGLSSKFHIMVLIHFLWF